MERGLLWLPLLALFIGLAWAGRNEYQKVEAYRLWAEKFQRAKYDLYAVLGQDGSNLTWGKPTRKAPVDLKTFSLTQVQEIFLRVDGQTVNLEAPPSKGRAIVLEFVLIQGEVVQVPFTQVSLAAKWGQVLTQDLQALRF
ncbi:MAG: hypothetical protein HC780_18100 [Leptolyngbyaceae cyanobacterium CSU_1_3]|nr:hypothetical protein [Leptolyngbyaceae cyanobacterium CSU_1_3]